MLLKIKPDVTTRTKTLAKAIKRMVEKAGKPISSQPFKISVKNHSPVITESLISEFDPSKQITNNLKKVIWLIFLNS